MHWYTKYCVIEEYVSLLVFLYFDCLELKKNNKLYLFIEKRPKSSPEMHTPFLNEYRINRRQRFHINNIYLNTNITWALGPERWALSARKPV